MGLDRFGWRSPRRRILAREPRWHAVRILAPRHADPAAPTGARGPRVTAELLRAARRHSSFWRARSGCLIAVMLGRRHVPAEGLRRRRPRPVRRPAGSSSATSCRAGRPRRPGSSPATWSSGSATGCSNSPRTPRPSSAATGSASRWTTSCSGTIGSSRLRSSSPRSGSGRIRTSTTRCSGRSSSAWGSSSSRAGAGDPRRRSSTSSAFSSCSSSSAASGRQLLLDRLLRPGGRDAGALPPAGGLSPLLPPLPVPEGLPLRGHGAPARSRRPRSSGLQGFLNGSSLLFIASLHAPADVLRAPDGRRSGGVAGSRLILRRAAGELDPPGRLPDPRTPRARPLLVDERGPGSPPARSSSSSSGRSAEPSRSSSSRSTSRPSSRNERYLAWGVVPMALIPLTFAYAIVRFRLFDVQVIVRKSIVYGVLTAVVTGLYALAVVAGNAVASSRTSCSRRRSSRSPSASRSSSSFDPLRRRMQSVVDRLFFRDRADFQEALLDMSRSVVSQLERDKIRELLTDQDRRAAPAREPRPLDAAPRGRSPVEPGGAGPHARSR